MGISESPLGAYVESPLGVRDGPTENAFFRMLKIRAYNATSTVDFELWRLADTPGSSSPYPSGHFTAKIYNDAGVLAVDTPIGSTGFQSSTTFSTLFGDCGISTSARFPNDDPLAPLLERYELHSTTGVPIQYAFPPWPTSSPYAEEDYQIHVSRVDIHLTSTGELLESNHACTWHHEGEGNDHTFVYRLDGGGRKRIIHRTDDVQRLDYHAGVPASTRRRNLVGGGSVELLGDFVQATWSTNHSGSQDRAGMVAFETTPTNAHIYNYWDPAACTPQFEFHDETQTFSVPFPSGYDAIETDTEGVVTDLWYLVPNPSGADGVINFNVRNSASVTRGRYTWGHIRYIFDRTGTPDSWNAATASPSPVLYFAYDAPACTPKFPSP